MAYRSKCPLMTQSGHEGTLVSIDNQIAFPRSAMYGMGRVSSGRLAMNALINVVLPVFGIIVTGYLAGRFEALGPDSAAALNRFVFYFALPTVLFVITARRIFNWPFIGGALLTLLIAVIVGRFWFQHPTWRRSAWSG